MYKVRLDLPEGNILALTGPNKDLNISFFFKDLNLKKGQLRYFLPYVFKCFTF